MRDSKTPGLLVLLAACALGAACGDEPAAPEPVELPLPVVDMPAPAARVRYALERLEQGPAPLGPLRVPDIHRRNLELAEDDLIAYEREAQRQLAEPARIARVTQMARRNADPWHNVLRVLLGMETLPESLVLAWTRPVLDVAAELPTLRLEAARVLSRVRGAAAAEVMLALFRIDPQQRELSTMAFAALVREGGAMRRAALDLALRQGAPLLWADVWNRLGGLVPPGEVDPEIADALAWWAGLAGGSGPRIPRTLPHLKAPPWSQARLAVDPAVPGPLDGSAGGQVYGPLPSSVTHAAGWFATELVDQPIFPLYAALLTGKMPAAEARCVLAGWDMAPYAAAVDADRALRDEDEMLYYAAKHCMVGPVTGDDAEIRAALARELDAPLPWDAPRVRTVRRLLSSFSTCDAEGVWALLARVLFELHPLDVCRPAIEQAYEVMRSRPHDLVPLVAGELESSDAARAGVALHLARRARDPAYLPALERLLDATSSEDGPRRTSLRRTLTFIYSRGYGIEPARYGPFVERYLGWLDAAEEREFVGLATGLLDFGEPGRRAFMEGLGGEHRALFLAAWPRDRRLVPVEVAAAALAPMGAETSRAEVAQVMALAYATFPPAATPHLVALRRRLLPALRPLVDPALERVRHRAPLRRQVN